MVQVKKYNTLLDLLTTFKDELACQQHLAQMKWSGKVISPFTGSDRVYKFKDGKTFKCAETRKKFNARTGTIFEESKIPLQKWFGAIYLITNHKKGISSVQLSKDLGVTQKTAWFMLHRLRMATLTKEFNIEDEKKLIFFRYS